MVSVRRSPVAAFLVGAAFVYGASRVALASSAYGRNPRAVAAAVALDLTLTTTILFWFLVVRARRAGAAAVVSVFLAGAAVASRTLPAEHRGLVGALAALAEVAALSFLAWKAVRLAVSLRETGGRLAPEDAIQVAAREALGVGRLADALATEAGIVLLALFSWRRKPDVPAGTVPFSCHRTSGAGALAWGIAIAGVAESIGVHALVAHWSTTWAWVATGTSAYGLLWVAGDFRGVVLRPTCVDASTLHIRVGLRWRASIPLRDIRRAYQGPDAARHPGCLRVSPLGPPNLYLHLAAPTQVVGPFGIRRRGDCVGLRVDDPEGLARLLETRSAEA